MDVRETVDDTLVNGVLQGACAIVHVVVGGNRIEHGVVPRKGDVVPFLCLEKKTNK